MLILVAGLAASGAAVMAPSTDFGVRLVSAPAERSSPTIEIQPQIQVGRGAIVQPATAIGARWGRVTSTYRSAAHNRAVGGVRNSWHLSGRAIDIARRPGVSHAQIASAFRAAGYWLIESLDEGDHSHFAFGNARSDGRALGIAQPQRAPVQIRQIASEMTDWGIVTVSNRQGRGSLGR